MTEQELLEEQILELVDVQASKDAMPRGDLQGVVAVIASKYQLIEEDK